MHIDSNLKWNTHVNYICAKASSRLYFLKQLRKCSTSIGDMLHFYTAVIRPVLEYACPVWSSSITKEQSSHIKAVQRRAAGPKITSKVNCTYFDESPPQAKKNV